MPTTAALSTPVEFLAVFRDRQTYRNLRYLFVAIPLGFVYYALLATADDMDDESSRPESDDEPDTPSTDADTQQTS